MNIKYNDYELLYLINEKDDEAFEIMFEKYKPLIISKIKSFKIKPKNFDDFFQEGLIMLNVAINTYNTYKCKTFTRYFELILQRRIRDLLAKEKNYFYNVTVVDYIPIIKEPVYEEKKEFSYKGILTELEKKTFELIYENGKTIEEIANLFSCDQRKVYNAISRAKTKIKKMEKNKNG